MTGIIINLILIVLSIAVPVTMMAVQKWEEIFIILSAFIATLAIINLVLIIFGVY